MATSTEWMTSGLCTKRLWPDAWFPDSMDAVARRAKSLCKACPVKDRCAQAGKTEKHGIWGGTMHTENKAKTEIEREFRRNQAKTLGSQRRLQALSALGWSGREISADIRRYSGLSLSPQSLERLRDEGEERVPTEVVEAIERCYRRLGRTLSSANNSVLLVRRAQEKGWPPPRCWRGLDIEDPEVYPDELL